LRGSGWLLASVRVMVEIDQAAAARWLSFCTGWRSSRVRGGIK
jgi:hypothetical protein